MELEAELQLPGMIEKAERSLLFKKSHSMPRHHIAIEFGCFLGASTACIAHGLKKSGNKNQINSFDLFTCTLNNAYSLMVEKVATKINCELRVETDNKTKYYNYKHVTEKLLKQFKNVSLNQTKIEHSAKTVRDKIHGKKIGLLHLDAPKNWELLRTILNSTVESLGEGTLIFEQDFFFECAPTIILAFYYLETNGYCTFAENAASTAVFQWESKLGHVNHSVTEEVDKFMTKMKFDKVFMIKNIFECSKLYSKRHKTNESQRQALNCALFNYILSRDFEETFKIEYGARLLEESNTPINNQLTRKIARTLSRAYDKGNEIFMK